MFPRHDHCCGVPAVRSEGSEREPWDALAPPELEDRPPDRDAVPLLESLLPDHRSVHQRSVRGPQVGDDEVAVLAPDLRVPAAGPGVREHDVRLRQPSDDYPVTL